MEIASKTHIEENKNGYDEFLKSIRDRFNNIVGSGIPLFTTNAEGLFDAFLDNLPAEARQHYTCHACRGFVNRFGGLVFISDDGTAEPAIWGNVPDFFTPSVTAIEKIISKSKVNGVFLSDKEVLGRPVTGEWRHMSVKLPYEMIHHFSVKTVEQAIAEKREEFKMLITGLQEYPEEALDQAVTLLKTESLYRSEKCMGVAEWLKDLHVKRGVTKNNALRENLVWLAVATAPPGFCHVKSTMIGTLLDDIVAGLSFDVVQRRFAEKMHLHIKV
ncbi:hypothetical protein THIOM_003149 [Candidatus Thiomargarita nelsonii]|uniref:Uncharacterized protein n=1 Tax=Candidatus Thiomargarita nelsonii TaxID=1003181 RepID=A0A176RZ76_9GAMM|nr:hypothetical protein THIOM_003149 [Candidatus Thiomargarita nelsonii]